MKYMKRAMVFILFFASAPILLAARVIQQLYMIDPLTGFYQDGFSGVGTAISVLCFALIAVTLAMVWLSHPQVPEAPAKSVPLGIGAAAAAIGIAANSAGYMMSKATADLAIGALGIGAAISLAYYAITLFMGRKYPAILTLLPIAYACVRLVICFIKYTGEVTVTDSVFDIATMCLVLLFFYSSGKLISGVAGKRSHILFYSYGLCAAFFCADSVFVRIILMLTRSNAALHGAGAIDTSYIGIAIYVVIAVWVLSGFPKASESAPIAEAEIALNDTADNAAEADPAE